MLVLDELPLASLVDEDGSIDASLYPNFAELAAASSWFRNATAVSPSTWHAVPSIATGMYPTEGAPVARDHPDSIFTMLGGSYEMDVTESITRLCPTSICEAADIDRTQSLRRLGGDVRRVVRSQLALARVRCRPRRRTGREPRGWGWRHRRPRSRPAGALQRLPVRHPRRRASHPPLPPPPPAARPVAVPAVGAPVRDPGPRPGQGRRRVDRPGLAARPRSAAPPPPAALRRPPRGRPARAPAGHRHLRRHAPRRDRRPRHRVPARPAGAGPRGRRLRRGHPPRGDVGADVRQGAGAASGRDARHQRRDGRRGAHDRRPARRRDGMDARRPVGVLRPAPRQRRRRSSRAGSTRSASTSARGSRWRRRTAGRRVRGRTVDTFLGAARGGRDRGRRPAFVAGGAATGPGRRPGERPAAARVRPA